MVLKLYNTMTRKKEAFKPQKGKAVKLYTCGPTVYDYAHIGNLKTFVNEDLLKRYLLWKGFRVKHVMNITDVGHLTDDADEGEDKMVLAERREHKSAWEIAKFYEQAFKDDIVELNVIPSDILCRATEHIKEQIALVQILEKKGYTYAIQDGVYFDTSKLKDYGKLAKLKIESLKAGARVEVAEGKRSPADFALWKFTPSGVRRHMEWDSPWGRGFPGWHIECSAMAMKYLGETLDIHAGGIDHIPVHHTNEIAQSEAATRKPFVKYWFHCEFLNVGETKMAKSKGNFTTLHSVVEQGFTPRQLRFFYLQAHYRTQQSFTEETLRNASNGLDKLDEFMDRLAGYISGSKNSPAVKKLVTGIESDFEKAMDDDLNVPVMWASFHKFVHDVNKLLDSKKLSQKDAIMIHKTIINIDEVFGVLTKEEKKLPAEAKKLLQEREEHRKAKRFKESDAIRRILREKYGVDTQDTPDGPKWRFVR